MSRSAARSPWQPPSSVLVAALLGVIVIRGIAAAEEPLGPLLVRHCGDCHSGPAAAAGLAVDEAGFDLADTAVRERVVLMHDRVAKGQMPPAAEDLPQAARGELLAALVTAVSAAVRPSRRPR